MSPAEPDESRFTPLTDQSDVLLTPSKVATAKYNVVFFCRPFIMYPILEPCVVNTLVETVTVKVCGGGELKFDIAPRDEYLITKLPLNGPVVPSAPGASQFSSIAPSAAPRSADRLDTASGF